MKKILSLLLVSVLIVGSFAACKRENKPVPAESVPSAPEKTTVYTDGNYSVSYDVPALDRTLDFLKVSVSNDEFTITEYGMKESEDMPAASEAASSAAAASTDSVAAPTEHEATAAEYAKEIQAEFEAAGNVDDMSAVEDAEDHTYRFQRMMRTITELAKKGDSKSATLGKYADGNYESTMPNANADGWTEFVTVTVADGEISAIDFNARKGDDKTALITTDAELNKGDVKPSAYYPQVAKNFTEAGEDLTKMLSPSGGGEASKSFSKLMKPLLINMQAGGDSTITASRYMDGEYKAQYKDFDKYGWKEYVVLNIKNGKVTVKEFDAIAKADETKLKSEESALTAKIEEKTAMTFTRAVGELIKNLAAANDDVLKVDNVAGATVSSNDFKLLIGQILATTAIEGDTKETIIVDRIEVK